MGVPASLPSGSADPSAVPLQVLSLDGGGLRGIFTAAALAAWEEDFGTSIADHFDLIVGTSTGGVIALALGLGVSPAEVLSTYVDHRERIFPAAQRGWRGWRRLVRPQYDPSKLREVLRDLFGDRLLGDSRVRLAIPSYDLAADHVHLFRTPHHADLRRDWRVPVLEIALATTAAPIFLPTHRMEAHRLIDGGVWANNPTLVGVAECFDRLGGQSGFIRILSVGTTSEVRDRRVALDNGGLLAWRSDGLDVLLRGQCLAATNPRPAHPRAAERDACGCGDPRRPSHTRRSGCAGSDRTRQRREPHSFTSAARFLRTLPLSVRRLLRQGALPWEMTTFD